MTVAQYRRYVVPGLRRYMMVIALVIVISYQLLASKSYWRLYRNHKIYEQFGETTVNTALGWRSYEQLNRTVFRDFGYSVARKTVPIPTLRYIEQPVCSQVFSDWLEIAQSKSDPVPRNTIPLDLEDEFLLHGNSKLHKIYMNSHFKSTPNVWDMVEEWVATPEEDLWKICNYFHGGMGLYYALKHYPPRGKVGIVVGSLTPWAEAFALKTGAAEVLTIDYQELKIVGTNRVKYEHAINFAKNWEKHHEQYDFVISFSSLEHSGMGRYGDVLDPIGDIREIQKIACSLKKGGMLYLGFPRGRDAVVYNLHRVYGRIRLAMMMTGFDWLGSFRGSDTGAVELTLDDFDASDDSQGRFQDLYVLRKR